MTPANFYSRPRTINSAHFQGDRQAVSKVSRKGLSQTGSRANDASQHIGLSLNAAGAGLFEECLYVQILNIKGVLLDEVAAGFDVFSHKGSEDGLGLGDVFELD